MATVATSTLKRVRLAELDVLRFVAAFAVVVFHYQSNLRSSVSPTTWSWVEWPARFGYLGVDLFFLISGYVIVMSAAGRTARSFLVHRVIRLYPSFWIALCLTTIAIWLGRPEAERPSVSMIIANITMLPGYFGQRGIDDVYWTLAVEWKFYALIALVLALGLKQRIEWIVYTWISLLALQTLAIDSRVLKSVSIFPYGSFFAVGVVLNLIREHGLDVKRGAALLIGSGLCLVAAVRAMPEFIHAAQPHDATAVLGIVSAMVFVFLAIVLNRRPIPVSRPIQILGSVTYPLYLLHRELGGILLSEWNPFQSGSASVGASVIVVTLMSVAMAVFVELRLVTAIARSRGARAMAGEQRGADGCLNAVA